MMNVDRIALEMYNTNCFDFTSPGLDLTPLIRQPRSLIVSYIVQKAGELDFDFISSPSVLKKKIGYYLGQKVSQEYQKPFIPVQRDSENRYIPNVKMPLGGKCLLVDDYLESGRWLSGLVQFVKKGVQNVTMLYSSFIREKMDLKY